jgi:hypothetical protein
VQNTAGIPTVLSDVASDTVDFASLAAAGISDAAKLSDPATAAAAIVDLVARVEQLEQFARTVGEQIGSASVLGRIKVFIEQHFRE